MNFTTTSAKSVKMLVTKQFIPISKISTPFIDNMCSFSNKLTTEVSKHKGFQISQSYWDLTDPNKLITISAIKSVGVKSLLNYIEKNFDFFYREFFNTNNNILFFLNFTDRYCIIKS